MNNTIHEVTRIGPDFFSALSTSGMTSNLLSLRQAASEIFTSALQKVDARSAIHRAVSFDYPTLRVCDRQFNTTGREIYVLAIGKAAHEMAQGINEILGETLSGGLIAGPATTLVTPKGWQVFAGGHPLPNAQSLAAAKTAFALMQRAEEQRGIVMFLVSGGGSAMVEWPLNDHISLADLRQANHALVTSGATIKEINAVRRAFSAVKGGRLACRAPRATQINLIVSDVNTGEEEHVASGPTILSTIEIDLRAVVDRYRLRPSLPKSVLESVDNPSFSEPFPPLDRVTQVILDNRHVLAAAAEKARTLGGHVVIDSGIIEQPIELGCNMLLKRLDELRSERDGQFVCLLSGGEFRCPVKGSGRGGRNSETVLRCAIQLAKADAARNTVVLSVGTDGIDGNSPAAGAIADQTTIARAHNASLDALRFLADSDSFSFFERLGEAIVTGPTGTNVRDLRIVLASP